LCEDTRVSKKLLSLIEEKHNITLNIKDKNFIALHAHNEHRFLQECKIDFDQNIIYMSDAGAPCISDPGAMLVDFCIKNNIKYDFIGGVSAFLSAFAMSGFLDTSFLFYGFLPNKGQNREDILKNILTNNQPIILYEAPHRIEKLISDIVDIDKDRVLFAIKELTKLHQKYIKDTAYNILQQLKEISTKGEWVVVISSNTKENIQNTSAIKVEDIQSLNIPPKQKAKLISKITGENIEA
jgi:16S rRNA (cytidine1402-2'-O)-methyltransferase